MFVSRFPTLESVPNDPLATLFVLLPLSRAARAIVVTVPPRLCEHMSHLVLCSTLLVGYVTFDPILENVVDDAKNQ